MGRLQQRARAYAFESNGEDPQEYRDSAPTEYSGYGGTGLYPISKNNGQYLIAMTRGAADQRDLPVRSYQFEVGTVDGNLQPIGALSQGTLSCTLKKK